MTETIEVQLAASDAQFTSDVLRASKAVAVLDAQEKKLARTAKALNVDEKKLAKALAISKAVQKKNQIEQKKAFQDTSRIIKGDMGPAIEALGTRGAIAAAAASALATAVIAGAVAAAGLLTTVTVLAVKTGAARDNTKGMLDVLTAGRGAQALKLIDDLAGSLGMKVQDARDKFIDFRQAGLDNKQSANLLKLVADLNTVDSSGKLAAEAIDKVLAHKGGAGTEAQMALLAKQAGVLGDGTKAAAAATSTLGGALARLDNAKTAALEQIFDSIKPKIDAAATKLADFAIAFLESEKGKAILDGLSTAIGKVADFVGELIDAFQGKGTPEMVNFAQAALKVGSALVAIGGFVGTAIGYLVKWNAFIAGIYSTVINLVPQMVSAGVQIIDGLISGITGAAGRLWEKVRGIASGIKNAFASALQIRSPSKVFEKLGGYIGQGLGQGIESSAPSGTEMAKDVTPTGAQMRNASSGSSGGLNITIENISVPLGADADQFARSIRRELTLMLKAMQLSKGVPA